MKENEIGTAIVESAIEVHRTLGPGLLESVYQQVLAYELREKGLMVEHEVQIPVYYKDMTFENGLRLRASAREEYAVYSC